MKITHDEFKAFFNGGLTLARREELLLAILTNPQCGRIASIFLLLEELNHCSYHDETVGENESPGAALLKIIKSGFSFDFISFPAAAAVSDVDFEVSDKIKSFRDSLERVYANCRNRDAKLVKRVLANYKVVNVKVGDIWKEEVSFIGDSAAAFVEIQRIVEPVVVFWSNHFDDSGMSMQEKVRSCAQKLLRKSSLSIYKCYNPKKGAFATYFDEAYRRELMKLLKKEIKIIFYDPTQYYQPEEELMVDGEAAIDVRMSLVDGMDIKNKLQKILPAVEWELFSERFMYGNRVEDIAEQHNCSMSKVYRRTDKSMNKVRKLLCINEYAF